MFIAFCAADGARASDPALEWQTLATAHLRVHFSQGGEPFARRVAAIGEEAYDELTWYFGDYSKGDVVHIVCTNEVDGANGLTRSQPYDQITLFAFSPEADSDLARYDDWLRLLVYHELTHTVQLNHAGLFFNIINGVFGKSYLPNHMLPQWFVEGIAVFAESTFTRGGRVKSAGFEQYLRMAALEGTLPESIGQLTSNPPQPPGGTWAYTFGGDFLAWIAERHGKDTIARFVDEYGDRLPFGLNLVAKRAFGEDFPTLFDAWREQRVLEAEATAGARRKAGLRTGQRLTFGGIEHHAPIWDGADALLYSATDGWSATTYRRGRLSPEGFVQDSLFKCDGGCGHAVRLPKGDLLMVSSDWTGPHRFFRDLFRVDLNTRQPAGAGRGHGKWQRITHGLRAREPDVDGTGKRATFVSAEWGQTALMETDLEGSAPLRTLIPYSADLQLAQPRYLPDGRIVFSAQAPGGFRDLYLRSADGSLNRLTQDPTREIAAVVHPDGRTVYFSADDEGIFDIFSLDLETRERRRVTRVLGGAINPAISPDGRRLAYQGWHATGWDLYVLELDAPGEPAAAPLEPEPPRYDPTVPPNVLLEPYAAWKTAWPRSWAPNLRTSPDATFLGFLFIGSDPVGDHSWVGTLDWNTTEMEVSAALSYSWSALRPRLSASVARYPGRGYLYTHDVLSTYHTENIFASVGISANVPDLLDGMNVGMELTGWWSVGTNRPEPTHDPGEGTPFIGEDQHRYGVRVSWYYARTERYAYSISNELGITLGMTFELFLAAFGNPADTFALTWQSDVFVPLMYARGHVLALLYSGGVRGGPESERGRFYVGGMPEQDLVQDLLNKSGIFGGYLRGFAPGAFSGDVYHQASTEYRLPIWDVYRGPGTLPFYIDRITGSLFSDMAFVYEGIASSEDFHASLGAEIQIGTTLLYALPAVFRLGYARALTPPVADQVYFVLGGGF